MTWRLAYKQLYGEAGLSYVLETRHAWASGRVVPRRETVTKICMVTAKFLTGSAFEEYLVIEGRYSFDVNKLTIFQAQEHVSTGIDLFRHLSEKIDRWSLNGTLYFKSVTTPTQIEALTLAVKRRALKCLWLEFGTLPAIYRYLDQLLVHPLVQAADHLVLRSTFSNVTVDARTPIDFTALSQPTTYVISESVNELANRFYELLSGAPGCVSIHTLSNDGMIDFFSNYCSSVRDGIVSADKLVVSESLDLPYWQLSIRMTRRSLRDLAAVTQRRMLMSIGLVVVSAYSYTGESSWFVGLLFTVTWLSLYRMAAAVVEFRRERTFRRALHQLPNNLV